MSQDPLIKRDADLVKIRLVKTATWAVNLPIRAALWVLDRRIQNRG